MVAFSCRRESITTPSTPPTHRFRFRQRRRRRRLRSRRAITITASQEEIPFTSRTLRSLIPSPMAMVFSHFGTSISFGFCNKTKKPKSLNWQERRNLKQQEDTQILAGLQSAIPESNVGFKMLKNMGYNPGSALGKGGIGLSEPVGLDIRRSREGIGAREEMNKVGTRKTFVDLETKKLKVIQGGASANSVRVCTICNVVCNSDKVFASHVAGEKHALKALGVSPGALKSKVPAHLKALHTTKKQMHLTPNTVAEKAAKGSVAYVPSSYCDVCKIDCNSQEVLNSHKMGKKHIKNMENLQASITPKPPSVPVQKDALVAGQAKPVADPPTKEDLEIKKQKVLNGGAVADRVRVCGICNVVCNSDTVFNSHITGQKHLAQVNKQQ